MTDREKVIKGIGICLDRFHCDADCPYYDSNTGCMEQLRDDALTLLKEQEPIAPDILDPALQAYWCGACGEAIDQSDIYCRKCGRMVKWE